MLTILLEQGFHTFLKGISPKINVESRLEFKLAYNNVTVQDVNHYPTGTHNSFYQGF